MGLNAVNEDILATLNHTDTSTDFWWLNNGVTILSTGAVIVGKSLTPLSGRGTYEKSLTEEYHLGQGTITYWLQQRCKECQNNSTVKEQTDAYYHYLKDRKSVCHAKKAETQRKITEIYHSANGTPGCRMMRDLLQGYHYDYSNTTIYKYMRELGLRSVTRRKKPNYRKGNAHKVFPNLLNQNFKTDKINQVWCTDFTYLFLSNGTVRYNCTIIDLYDRSVVASVNGEHITSELAIETLKAAIKRHKPEKGVILHSGQSRQFTSQEFVQFCEDSKVQQSMSRAGCPYDNAPMERYYNTLKNEHINWFTYKTKEELDLAVREFAYAWYNHLRPHTHNQGRIPYAARSA